MRDVSLRKRGIEIGRVKTILITVVIAIAFVTHFSANVGSAMCIEGFCGGGGGNDTGNETGNETGNITPTPMPVNYVAFGDSYSSGEGVRSFLPWTDVSGLSSMTYHWVYLPFLTIYPTGTGTGSVYFQTTPAGAKIIVDGSDTGKVTPNTVDGFFDEGTHLYKLMLPNNQRISGTFLLIPPSAGGATVDDNQCHRSYDAYSVVLGTQWGLNQLFFACSGGEMSNIDTSGQWNEPAQLQEPGVNYSNAGLVTMTIGGNDAGFEPILSTCIWQTLNPLGALVSFFGLGPGNSCGDDINFVNSVYSKINNMRPRLNETYTEVLTNVSPTNTSVIVAGYPHLFSDSSLVQFACQQITELTPDDQVFLNTVSDVLDTTLIQATGDAGVNFVDVRQNFTGHDVCGLRGPWINPLIIYPFNNQKGSFHPNIYGQKGYATAFENYILSAKNLTPQGYPVNPVPIPPPPIPTPNPNSTPRCTQPGRTDCDSATTTTDTTMSTVSSLATDTTDTTNTTNFSIVVQELNVSPVVAQTIDCEDAYRAGQQLSVSGNGFAPGASVLLYLTSQSGEQQVGNITADSTGNVVSTVSIPINATGFNSSESQAGIFLVAAIGLGPDGAHVGDMAMNLLVPPSSSCGLGSVSGVKFNDLNGNGIHDIGEPGLANWTITLTNSSGSMITQTTAADGSYNFTNLTDDNYIVGEVIQPGWIQTAPAVSVNGTATYTVNISGGNAVIGEDFGNFQLGSVSGMKFEDLNANGVRDINESGLAGWNITINGTDTIKNMSVNQAITTDANGNYNFTGLTAGTYVISESLKSNWIQTVPATSTYTVNITSGSNITGQDFGNFHKGNITGGGWINITGDPKATFGIVGYYPNASNTPNGSVVYQDHISKLNVTSIQINTVATTLDKKKGTITGLAQVNSVGSYPFVVYVEDNAEPGKGADVFKIALPTYPYANGAVLSGGNIQIHS